VHAAVRARVAPLTDDRPPAPDIAAIDAIIASGALEAIDGARCQVMRADFSN
jgi:histidine ammonia-lyase